MVNKQNYETMPPTFIDMVKRVEQYGLQAEVIWGAIEAAKESNDPTASPMEFFLEGMMEWDI